MFESGCGDAEASPTGMALSPQLPPWVVTSTETSPMGRDAGPQAPTGDTSSAAVSPEQPVGGAKTGATDHVQQEQTSGMMPPAPHLAQRQDTGAAAEGADGGPGAAVGAAVGPAVVPKAPGRRVLGLGIVLDDAQHAQHGQQPHQKQQQEQQGRPGTAAAPQAHGLLPRPGAAGAGVLGKRPRGPSGGSGPGLAALTAPLREGPMGRPWGRGDRGGPLAPPAAGACAPHQQQPPQLQQQQQEGQHGMGMGEHGAGLAQWVGGFLGCGDEGEAEGVARGLPRPHLLTGGGVSVAGGQGARGAGPAVRPGQQHAQVLPFPQPPAPGGAPYSEMLYGLQRLQYDMQQQVAAAAAAPYSGSAAVAGMWTAQWRAAVQAVYEQLRRLLLDCSAVSKYCEGASGWLGVFFGGTYCGVLG